MERIKGVQEEKVKGREGMERKRRDEGEEKGGNGGGEEKEGDMP